MLSWNHKIINIGVYLNNSLGDRSQCETHQCRPTSEPGGEEALVGAWLSHWPQPRLSPWRPQSLLSSISAQIPPSRHSVETWTFPQHLGWAVLLRSLPASPHPFCLYRTFHSPLPPSQCHEVPMITVAPASWSLLPNPRAQSSCFGLQ